GTEFHVEMGNRLVKVHVVRSDSAQRTGVIRVQIGPPVVLNPEGTGRTKYVQRIRMLSMDPSPGGTRWTDPLTLPDDILHVSMGNPHTVLFVESLESTPVIELGPEIERHTLFPNRTNVEFAQVIAPSMVRVRVWERGSGETLACGSGACAVAVAGIESGLLIQDSERAIQVKMPGGTLRVLWDDHDQVFLEGPAEIAFEGLVHLPVSDQE
ncbi:MAG: diaminopimelate epimerase, partial [Planctomycetota bacterium]